MRTNARSELMIELLKRRRRVKLMLLVSAAVGCTCATVSGTLAAFSYSASPYAPATAERFA
jgi:hypothetical protein